MASIFISYRRDDSPDITGRIFDRIIGKFGKSAVFRDVDSLRGGQDFPDVLRSSIQHNTIMLVIIGRSWLNITQERITDPNDYARIEIETALQRHATIIPILIQGAAMPTRDQLPPSIADLARRHAIAVRPDPDFSVDIESVMVAITPHMRSLRQQITRFSLPAAIVVIVALLAALIGPRFFSPATCTQRNDGNTAAAGLLYTPPKTNGISGQSLHIIGSGNAESSFIDVRPAFNAVNGTCIFIDRGGGGWLINQPNKIGVTDFNIVYDTRSRTQETVLADYPIAIIPEVVIVGKGVYARGIHNLSRKQIVNIFHGDVSNWKQIDGGPNARIDAIQRTDNGTTTQISGITLTFDKTVMLGVPISSKIASTDNSVATLQNVANDPYTISIVALEALNFYPQYMGQDYAISIDGHTPTSDNIYSGAYEFWDIVHAYTVGAPDTQTATGKGVQALLDAVTSPTFQSAEFPFVKQFSLQGIRTEDLQCRTSIDVCIGT